MYTAGTALTNTKDSIGTTAPIKPGVLIAMAYT
jgi:hypothetical protein